MNFLLVCYVMLFCTFSLVGFSDRQHAYSWFNHGSSTVMVVHPLSLAVNGSSSTWNLSINQLTVTCNVSSNPSIMTTQLTPFTYKKHTRHHPMTIVILGPVGGAIFVLLLNSLLVYARKRATQITDRSSTSEIVEDSLKEVSSVDGTRKSDSPRSLYPLLGGTSEIVEECPEEVTFDVYMMKKYGSPHLPSQTSMVGLVASLRRETSELKRQLRRENRKLKGGLPPSWMTLSVIEEEPICLSERDLDKFSHSQPRKLISSVSKKVRKLCSFGRRSAQGSSSRKPFCFSCGCITIDVLE